MKSISALTREFFPQPVADREQASTNIVDELIGERAPGLSGSGVGRFLLRRCLHSLLDYEKAVELAQRVERLGGHEIFAVVRQLLDPRLVVSGLEHVPATGRLMVVSNHPTGLADGIAAYDALARIRSDIWFLANADALRVAARLDEIIVPVEWVSDKRNHSRTKQMLSATSRVMKGEQTLVVFPSGRLAHLSWRGLRERPWQPTIVALARKHRAPILPMRIVARNSALFYAFSTMSRELRDITLFHELLNKRRRLFELQIAPPIAPADLPDDPIEASARLRRYVEQGLRDREMLHAVPERAKRLAAAA
jgi:putative hemolysin